MGEIEIGDNAGKGRDREMRGESDRRERQQREEMGEKRDRKERLKGEDREVSTWGSAGLHPCISWPPL